MKRVAVVLAGGKGERFGSHVPKQFVKLSGRLVIEYTIDVFEAAEDIDDIIVVCPEAYIEFLWELVARNGWQKISRVAVGGIDRFGSTYSALATLQDYGDDTSVLFHDAVRPLLSQEIIGNCLKALRTFEAVDVVIPSSDTLVVVKSDGCIESIPVRASMRRGQTPQGFKLRTIREAYRLANEQRVRDFTCDCGVVRSMLPHTLVATVPGSETNIKITNQLDLFVVEKLMQTAGSSVPEHPPTDMSGRTVVVFGGSSGIGEAVTSMARKANARVWIASRAANDVDVAERDAVEAFLEEVVAASGSIDYIVNCAGLLVRKPLVSMLPEEIGRLIQTNYVGAVNVALAGRRHLAHSRGMLVNFTSSSYTRGRANYAIYSSTKSAVVNLTQALAEEWAPDRIRVNCINPERTRTPMRAANFGLEPVETLLDPQVVASRTLQVLCSNYSGMIVDVRQKLAASPSV